MPTVKPVVIMGAGPAGLTAALELVRSGREVIVWEADASYVGGLARTVQAEGYRFDIGGHPFHSSSPEVTEFWRKVLPDDFIESRSLTRILHKGKFLDYPVNPRKAGFAFGFFEGMQCSWSFSSAQAKPIQPEETPRAGAHQPAWAAGSIISSSKATTRSCSALHATSSAQASPSVTSSCSRTVPRPSSIRASVRASFGRRRPTAYSSAAAPFSSTAASRRSTGTKPA